VQKELAERGLSDFIRLGWRYIDPQTFISNWHIDAICEHLEAVSAGQSRRLLINIPPRHMKSLGVSVAWPAWTWAQKPRGALAGPHVRWLFASYAQTLSIRDSVKCRRLIESPWYQANWGDRLKLTSDQNTKIRFDNDAHGYRLATSVDGALTGEGGDIVVVDDPHNVREAESEAVRNSVLSWWDEAMSTRLNDPRTGAYVVIMQRVHEKDLSGHILARNHGWDHLCIPARYEPDHPHAYAKDRRKAAGELLWPARVGETELSTLERSLGSYGSAGQLQQRPAPREGGLFKRHWFKIVRAAPAGLTRVRAWDLAATEAKQGTTPAYTAGLKMGRAVNGDLYIEDVRRDRLSPGGVEAMIVNTAKQDGKECRISLPQDPGQAGKAQAQYLIRQLQGFNARATPETGDKLTRAEPVSAQAEAGNIYLVEGDWNDAFLNEVASFPNGAFKDQVDAMSRAFMEVAKAGPSLMDLYGDAAA
jgi:predicted phage terminase large subunit-like protein